MAKQAGIQFLFAVVHVLVWMPQAMRHNMLCLYADLAEGKTNRWKAYDWWEAMMTIVQENRATPSVHGELQTPFREGLPSGA
eukprot:1146314-Pelagomonas_calceolata.AAC.5